MRSLFLSSGIGLLLLCPHSAASQQMDPALMGVWKLDVAQSTFGGGPSPAGGQVNWTEHGWVFVLQAGDGSLYADGAVTDHGGCILIGVSNRFSCQVKVLSPRHVRLWLYEGAALRRLGDIELVDSNTTRTVHHVTPGDGPPYVETTIWHRDSPN